jgi:protein-S-isoprenylcysteine O-methyltransferase Ste14
MRGWRQIARRLRVPLGFAFAVVYIVLAQPTVTWIIAGLSIALAGLLLRGLASGYVKKNETLTVSGPYAHTRNPLYLGSVILAVGFTIAARNWWIAIVAAILLIAIYFPVILSEEEFLRARFPEFARYEEKVPRLLPRFRCDTGASGSFSWHLYCKHREYNAALGFLLMAAILVVKTILERR